MENIAVIDIGSNSVRLMLLENGVEEQRLETTRLGQGVAGCMLQPEPLRRTIEAIEAFYALAVQRGAQTIYAFATSAVRDARNRDALLLPVRQRCGLTIDVLPGQVEAQLAYLGAAQGKRACVVDIGGASTELVAGQGRVERAVSLQVGAVRLKERCGQDRGAAEAFLDELFSAQRAAFAAYDDAPLLGIGGTLTTLAAMQLRLELYDPARVNGFVLTHENARSWVDRLWPMPAEQRSFPGLKPTRADIIAHGALIIERLLHAFSRDSVTVSTSDNLRGYIAWKQRR